MIKHDIGREPAFPLKHLVTGDPPKRKERGGRIIQCGRDQAHFARGEFAEACGGYDHLLSVVTKDDVVYLPVWDGNLDRKCRDAGDEWLSEDAPNILAFLQDLAPRVHAVLIGNAGVELNFWRPAHVSGGYNRHIDEMLGFVERSAEWVLAAGGRPAFGTVDWDLLFDAYGDRRLARAMKSCNALQLCFCGYTVIPQAWCDRSADLYSRQIAWLDEHERKRPYITVMRYLDELDVWSGCNGREGLAHKNDVYLSFYNYKAGFYRP